jgi:hypothetical protein
LKAAISSFFFHNFALTPFLTSTILFRCFGEQKADHYQYFCSQEFPNLEKIRMASVLNNLMGNKLPYYDNNTCHYIEHL